jgi:cysteine synthase
MKAFGAQVTDVISDNKKITEKLIKELIETSRKISIQENHWWADQLNNRDAEEGYYPLGDEIWQQTEGRIDAFVHVVSTAHSIHGITKALRKHNSGIMYLLLNQRNLRFFREDVLVPIKLKGLVLVLFPLSGNPTWLMKY